MIDAANAYLCQKIDEHASFEDSLQQLRDLFAAGRAEPGLLAHA
jgi:hypothetical protein